MRIVFFANHFITEFFHAVALRLQKRGHEIFWITSGNIWANWLRHHGVANSNLLDLSAFGPQWAKKKSLAPEDELELRRLEGESGLTINNLIMMDRLLSAKPHAYARSCLAVAGREIRRFLLEKQTEVLFSEATWALELLAISICRQLGGRNYCPATVRIPSGRFGFFEGYTQSSLVYLREPNDADIKEAEKFYDYFLDRSPRPSYMRVSAAPPRVHLDWSKKLFTNLRRKHRDPFDEMQPPPAYLVRRRWSAVWNKWRLSLTRPFEDVTFPPSRPYVLTTLHQQPEASIDILGSYFSNQCEYIRTLARCLPATHELYVKEHLVCIGARPPEFYRLLSRIPAVRLLSPYADNNELIRHANLVVAVSGTAAYEAALYGIPAMTVAPMYFGRILTRNGINPYRESFAEIFSLLAGNGDRRNAEEIRHTNIDFLAWVIAQSFAGIISDPRHEADCMTTANLDAVAEAMDIVIQRQSIETVR